METPLIEVKNLRKVFGNVVIHIILGAIDVEGLIGVEALEAFYPT